MCQYQNVIALHILCWKWLKLHEKHSKKYWNVEKELTDSIRFEYSNIMCRQCTEMLAGANISKSYAYHSPQPTKATLHYLFILHLHTSWSILGQATLSQKMNTPKVLEYLNSRGQHWFTLMWVIWKHFFTVLACHSHPQALKNLSFQNACTTSVVRWTGKTYLFENPDVLSPDLRSVTVIWTIFYPHIWNKFMACTFLHALYIWNISKRQKRSLTEIMQNIWLKWPSYAQFKRFVSCCFCIVQFNFINVLIKNYSTHSLCF